MKYLFFIGVAVLLSVSCQNSAHQTPQAEVEKDGTRNDTPLHCYQYTGNRDTIDLKLIMVGEAITGTLVYKLFEKDANRGTIQGRMKSDILLADYTFMAEGKRSVRQVAFKLSDKTMLEGFGDMEDSNNGFVFKNPGSLQFNNNRALVEISCTN